MRNLEQMTHSLNQEGAPQSFAEPPATPEKDLTEEYSPVDPGCLDETSAHGGQSQILGQNWK